MSGKDSLWLLMVFCAILTTHLAVEQKSGQSKVGKAVTQGEPDEDSFVNQALSQASASVRALLAAKEKLSRQKYREALTELKKIKNTSPEEEATKLILMGQCYEGLNDARALASYVKARSIAPTVPASLLREATLALDAGNPEKAKNLLERYVSLEPGNPEACCFLYLVYAMLDEDGQDEWLRKTILLDGPEGTWLARLKNGL